MEHQLEFYEIDYGGGKIPPDQRQRLLLRATHWLELLTLPQKIRCPQQEQRMLHALCAAADAIYELEQRVILKEQNGDLSVTYGARLSLTERQLVEQAIFPYLCGTGLLYRGVRAC